MRRRLLQICMALFFGSLLNVGVAWASGMLVNVFETPQESGFAAGSNGTWEVTRFRRPGALWIISVRSRSTAGGNMLVGKDLTGLIPQWSNLSQPTAQYQSGIKPVEIRFVDARGWPLLSMWSAFDKDYLTNPPGISVRHGIVTPLPAWHLGNADEPRLLPLRPIWSGFIVNTLTYASIVGLFYWGKGRLHRAVRKRRGRCLACGYDLRHVEHGSCPECGTKV